VAERAEGLPEEVARENACAKARAIAQAFGPERLVLGVDTVVCLRGGLYGKPADKREARAFLEDLSDQLHQVWSAIAVLERGEERVGVTATDVRFRRLDEAMLDWYLASGEWRGRAGAYAIQGRGAALVERIVGDYWNVVGLPVALLLRLVPELLAAKSASRNQE
jgi:septum formation protein